MNASDFASLFFATTLALGASSVTLLVAWIRARDRATLAETRLEERAEAPVMERRDQSAADLDVIARQVEQLTESHDFVVRLLGERGKSSTEPARSGLPR